MATTAEISTPRISHQARQWSELGVRWIVLVVTASVAFHHTIATIINSLRSQLELSYEPAIVVYAVFAAVATRRRNHPVLEIHDRETDIIVGGVTVGIALAATILLTPTLTGGYRMWRVDLLMLWAFTVGAGILLFGLRRVLQYRWAWLTLILIWPLPTRLVTYVVGGGDLRWVAAVHLLVVVTLLVLGRKSGERLSLAIPILALVVAGPLLILDPNRFATLIMVPGLTATVVGAVGWCVRDRPKAHSPARPAVDRPTVAIVGLVVVATISFLVIPAPPELSRQTELSINPAATGPGSLVPKGWQVLDHQDFPAESAYFGINASWQRYRIRAEDSATGPEAVDAEGRHREMVIDVTTTERPRTFDLFPLTSTYPVGSYEVSSPTAVALGHGVQGQLYSAIDSRDLLTWSMLTFTILVPADRAVADPVSGSPRLLSQRITLMLVDDHRAGARFPLPSRALLDSMRATLTAILRGNQHTEVPQIKNVGLLVTAGRQVLTQRAQGSV